MTESFDSYPGQGTQPYDGPTDQQSRGVGQGYPNPYQGAGYPPAYGPPAPSSGPLGRPRSIGISILLAIVTLGIYTFCWTYLTHKEIKRHTGRGIGGGLGLLVFFFVGLATFFLVPYEIEGMLQGNGRQSRVSVVTGFWYFLPLVGTIVWFVKVQGQLNDYWESLGARRG